MKDRPVKTWRSVCICRMDSEVIVLDEPAKVVRLGIRGNQDGQRPDAGFQRTIEWAGRSVGHASCLHIRRSSLAS